jgi:hypothetical protein
MAFDVTARVGFAMVIMSLDVTARVALVLQNVRALQTIEEKYIGKRLAYVF